MLTGSGVPTTIPSDGGRVRLKEAGTIVVNRPAVEKRRTLWRRSAKYRLPAGSVSRTLDVPAKPVRSSITDDSPLGVTLQWVNTLNGRPVAIRLSLGSVAMLKTAGFGFPSTATV